TVAASESLPDPADWRVTWYRALAALAAGDAATAAGGFESVYDMLPGEAAPKLAIAACAERPRQSPLPAPRYQIGLRPYPACVGAAFGLARAKLAVGARAGSVSALESVPAYSSRHVTAQATAVRVRLAAGVGELVEAELLELSDRIQRLELDQWRREQLAATL